jgi:hypothetical protein
LLLFWGKNRSGYVSNVYNAGLYAEEEVEQICDIDDIPMDINIIGIDSSKVFLNTDFESDLWMVVYKSGRIMRYIECEILKRKVKHRLKCRRFGMKVAL